MRAGALDLQVCILLLTFPGLWDLVLVAVPLADCQVHAHLSSSSLPRRGPGGLERVRCESAGEEQAHTHCSVLLVWRPRRRSPPGQL